MKPSGSGFTKLDIVSNSSYDGQWQTLMLANPKKNLKIIAQPGKAEAHLTVVRNGKMNGLFLDAVDLELLIGMLTLIKEGLEDTLD